MRKEGADVVIWAVALDKVRCVVMDQWWKKSFCRRKMITLKAVMERRGMSKEEWLQKDVCRWGYYLFHSP